MIINQIGGGGGIDINGVIEEYKCLSSNISAGDFVEYVNNISGSFTTSTNSMSYCAVSISETKVFIAYNIPQVLYGIVIEINNGNVTIGAETKLSDNSMSGIAINAIALSENKVFISHCYSGDYALYGMVCTISGTTITAGTDTAIDPYSYGARNNYKISAVALNENTVFIAHSTQSSDCWLYGIICTISGTTISKGTNTQLISYSGYGNVLSAVKLSENKVFISYSATSNYYLYGMVCTISGTTITAGTSTKIIETNYIAYNCIKSVAITETSVFIAHGNNSGGSTLYGIICTISGTTITAGTDTEIGGKCGYISAHKISENEVYIVHGAPSNNSSYGPYETICTISGTTITAGTDTILEETTGGGTYVDAAIVNGIPVIAHNSGKYIVRLVGVKGFESNILGIAKNGGTYGDTIGVYVPGSN